MYVLPRINPSSIHDMFQFTIMALKRDTLIIQTKQGRVKAKPTWLFLPTDFTFLLSEIGNAVMRHCVPEGENELRCYILVISSAGLHLRRALQVWSYLLGQRFSAWFVWKFSLQRGEGGKREGVKIPKQGTKNL